MNDVLILKMKFPNDPTQTLTAHQMVVALQDTDKIEFYSISSILGKEARVYGAETDNYFKIVGDDQINNGFKSPSFIDCAKSYYVNTPLENYNKLSGRKINCDLRSRILRNIEDCKERGVHVSYPISEVDLVDWNSKLGSSA